MQGCASREGTDASDLRIAVYGVCIGMDPPPAASARRMQTVHGVTRRSKNGVISVDPQTFDRMIQRLAQTRSRRSLVGGSLGAAVLATIGIGTDSRARTARTEKCLPANTRCGYTKKRKDGTKERITCSKCCHDHVEVNAKGRKKCSCRPNTLGCSTSSQCCSGFCGDNICQESPCPQIGEGCNENAGVRCCSLTGVCNSAGVCVRCVRAGERCTPGSEFRANPCCRDGTGLHCEGPAGSETCQRSGA